MNTSTKKHVLVHSVKLVHKIEIRLITNLIGITVLTPSEQ